jgi:ribonuclease HI
MSRSDAAVCDPDAAQQLMKPLLSKKTVDVKKKGHHKRIRNEVADDLGDYEHISQALKHCHDISTCKLDVPIESVEVIRSV